MMTTKAETMYPNVVFNVRKNLGLDSHSDESKDDQIAEMSRHEVLRRYLTWCGIIGYEDTIIGVIEEIYNVDLIDDKI